METLPDIKIVIADDHEIFRDGLKLMLSKYPEIIVIGEAQNGKELIEMVNELQPDVILADIKMPVMDGIEATKKLTQSHPHTGIIGLSMFDEDDLIIDMLEAGAKGYLIKNSDKKEIIEAITTVYKQQPYYCRNTTGKLIQMIANSKFNPYIKKEKLVFSEREKEIMALICQEYTNKEIGEKLFISTRTVEGHRFKLLEKIEVKNTVGLVVYAIKNNIYTPQKKQK